MFYQDLIKTATKQMLDIVCIIKKQKNTYKLPTTLLLVRTATIKIQEQHKFGLVK